MKEVLIVLGILAVMLVLSIPFAGFSQTVCTTVDGVVICSGDPVEQPRCFVLSDYTTVCQ